MFFITNWKGEKYTSASLLFSFHKVRKFRTPQSHMNYILHSGFLKSGLFFSFQICVRRHKGSASKVILKLKPDCNWVQGHLDVRALCKGWFKICCIQNLATSSWIAIQNLFIQKEGNCSIAMTNKVVECLRERFSLLASKKQFVCIYEIFNDVSFCMLGVR